jgi:hypothetical protein
MRSALIGATLACLAVAGCYLPTPEDPRTSFRSGGLARASFEMACPASQLTIIELAPTKNPYGLLPIGAQIGVSGCGKRMVYVCTANGWIANTSTNIRR